MATHGAPPEDEEESMTKRWFRRMSWFLITIFPLMVAGCRHGQRWHHKDMNQEDLAEHFKDKAEWVLDEVDATDAQVTQVNGILDGLAADLIPLKREHRGLGERLHELAGAERIDREELEAARKSMVDLFDRATSRVLTAVADAAEVLTVEQRRELVAEWKSHGH